MTKAQLVADFEARTGRVFKDMGGSGGVVI
jgi:hypothetical protein